MYSKNESSLELSWDVYEGVLNFLENKLVDSEELSVVEKDRVCNHDCPNIFYSKRNYLVPDSIESRLTQDERLVFQHIQDVKSIYETGDYNNAVATLQFAHVSLLQLTRSENWSLLCLIFADIHLLMADPCQASFTIIDSLSQFELEKYSLVRAAALCFQADIAMMKGYPGIALFRYIEATTIWKHHEATGNLAITQADLARAYYFQDDLVSAFSAVEESLKYAKGAPQFEPLAYSHLTAIELYSYMRDAGAAEKAFAEYTDSNEYVSAFRNTPWEKLIISRYYLERSNFEAYIVELLSICLQLQKYYKHEHLSEILSSFASYLNYEGDYDAALSMLIEWFEKYHSISSYRHYVFHQWLHSLETALRGNEKVTLANEIFEFISRHNSYKHDYIRNSVLGRLHTWRESDTLKRVLESVKGLQMRYFRRSGLRVDLKNGNIFVGLQLEPDLTFSPDQLKVFGLFARNIGVCFKNRDIIGSYDPKLAELEDLPRRDNYYIPFFRKLFRKLCGEQIIETRRGSGYYIPKL